MGIVYDSMGGSPNLVGFPAEFKIGNRILHTTIIRTSHNVFAALPVKVNKNLFKLTMSLKPLRELPRLYAWRFNPSTFSIAARFSEGNLLWKDRRASSIVGRERSLIRQEQHIAQVTNMAPQKGSRYEKWPVAILAAAEKSGALSITSQRAVIILEKFQALGSKSAEEFCTGVYSDQLPMTFA